MGKELTTLVCMFDAAAERYPDKTALIGPEGSFTYREVQEFSLGLALRLTRLLGADRPQKAVCLMAGKGALHVICQLAVLRAGHFYVSIDSAYPDERIQHIFEKADASLLITTARIAKEHVLCFPQQRTLFIDRPDWQKETDCFDRSVPEGILDVVFTSGTTGMPKGVIRSHRASSAAIWQTSRPFTAEDVFLSVSSTAFAVALFDTLLPLTLGATICLLSNEKRRDVSIILETILEHHVTAIFTTPQFGIALLDKWHAPLQKMVMAGDAIRSFLAPQTRVFNAYGMSEFTMVGMVEIPDGQAPCLPLCRPFDDVSCRIVDEEGNDLPDGQDGELWLQGPECFDGYVGEPELTAQKNAGGWLHTGDIVRRDADGLLYYVNRNPDMIKLNGQRIAPGEVESAAMERCGFSNAVCAMKRIGETEQLCLYYTGEPVDESTIRRKLAEVLAPYMIPAICMHLEQLPLNANMKLDRKALPDPGSALSMQRAAPANHREEALLHIAQSILSRTDFGVTDPLRALGLDSLHAMLLIAEAEAQDITLKLSDLIRFDTVRGLANARMSVGYLDGSFDPSRPTVVLVHGITSYSSLIELCTQLKAQFNLYIIEPIASHYRYIFADETMDDAALFYSDWLDYLLQGQPVSAFIGHCFGGELACRVAAAWQLRHPGAQTVLALDSPWHDRPDQATYELLHGLIPASQMDFWLTQSQKDITMINRLACPSTRSFHGRIVYYRALTGIREEPGNQPIAQSLTPENRQRFRELLAAQGGAFGMIDPELWRDKADQFELHELDTTHRDMLKGEFVRLYVDRVARAVAESRPI